MTTVPADIRLHDHAHGAMPEETLEALLALFEAVRMELRSDDPPRPRAALVADVRTPPPAGTWARWHVATRGGRGVGYATTEVDVSANPDLVWLYVYVVPDQRGRGIGRALAARALHVVQADLEAAPEQVGIDTLISSEIGRRLADRMEGEWSIPIGITGRKARLELAGLDRAALERERKRREEGLGDRYRMHFFEDAEIPNPETGFDLADFCATYEEIVNLMPMEDLQMERERFPPEKWHSLNARLDAVGQALWTTVCCEPGGRVVGLTSVNFVRADARRVSQWDTGVLAEAQGQGIGTLLKLDMLLRVLDRLPEARFIDTDNARSNAPMIAINSALGFHEHRVNRAYQLPVERLRSVLRI